MRIIWVMLGALLVSILLMDLGMVYVSQSKLYEVTAHALDAALIKGVNEQDATRGEINIDLVKAQAAADQIFRENLKLDGTGSNRLIKNAHLQLYLHPSTSNPYLEGKVTTLVNVMSPKIFGQDGIPINVERKQFHLVSFK